MPPPSRAHAASWKTSASVNRCPERTTETPCRTGAADQPRCGSHRAIAGGEDQPVSVRDDGRRAPRLRPRALLVEQELAAGVIDPRTAQVDHDLQREDQLAVEVTVQRVPVAGAVLEQDRRGLGLPGLVTHRQPLVEVLRPRRRPAEPGPPVAGDRQQPRVERLLQFDDSGRERLGEVAVLAGAEAVPAHVDGGPEPRVVGVERGDVGGLVRREQRPGQRATVVVQLGADRGPVRGLDPVAPGRPGRSSHAASRASSVRLASTPPR